MKIEFEYDKNKSKHGIDFEASKEFDKMFDNGEDISEFLDLKNIKSFKEFHKQREISLMEIDQDLLKYFPDEKSVNDALRNLAKILEDRYKKSA